MTRFECLADNIASALSVLTLRSELSLKTLYEHGIDYADEEARSFQSHLHRTPIHPRMLHFYADFSIQGGELADQFIKL